MSEMAGGAAQPYSPIITSGSVPTKSIRKVRSVATYEKTIGVSLIRSHAETLVTSACRGRRVEGCGGVRGGAPL